MDLKGKRIIVTGASSGIGLAVTEKLLDEGCTVLAAVRNPQKLALTHERLLVEACDVSRPEDVDRLFEAAVRRMGGIDVYVANAGFAYYEKLEAPDWAHARAIFDTNVLGLFHSAQRLKAIKGEEPFQFVSIASGMSFLSLPGYALYSATKAAIRGFADAYRFELGKGQRFQVVYPIATRTAFFDKAGGSPIPWPSQPVEVVARRIVAGIRNGRNSIFPSRVFRVTLAIGRVFPFVLALYGRIEGARFRAWQQREALTAKGGKS